MNATEQRAVLLGDVLAHPEQDEPRWIYADWLEEFGSPAEQYRADFIRLQIEIARTPEPEVKTVPGYTNPAIQSYRDLLHREWLAAEKCYGCGLLEVPGTVVFQEDFRVSRATRVQVKKGRLIWDRGWVREIQMDTLPFLRHAAELFAVQPITAVQLLDRAPCLPRQVALSAPVSRPDGVYWASGGAGKSPSVQAALPDSLFSLLSAPAIERWLKHYPSIGKAWADLSAACVLHGQQQARNAQLILERSQ